MKLRVDDVMPHLVERIPVDLQLTLVHMDIERDVGLVVAHLPSLCDLNSRSITPTVSSPARLRAMARSPTSLSSRGCGTDPRVVRRGPLENRRPCSVHVLLRFGWLWRVRVSLVALEGTLAFADRGLPGVYGLEDPGGRHATLEAKHCRHGDFGHAVSDHRSIRQRGVQLRQGSVRDWTARIENRVEYDDTIEPLFGMRLKRRAAT